MRLESPGRRKNLESECGDRRSPQGLVRTLGIIESSLGGGGGAGSGTLMNTWESSAPFSLFHWIE